MHFDGINLDRVFSCFIFYNCIKCCLNNVIYFSALLLTELIKFFALERIDLNRQSTKCTTIVQKIQLNPQPLPLALETLSIPIVDLVLSFLQFMPRHFSFRDLAHSDISFGLSAMLFCQPNLSIPLALRVPL